MHYNTCLLRHLRSTIGQNIHSHRLRRKMTLSYMSQHSGLPEWLLDHYELGKNDIGLQELLRISAVLDVPVSGLLVSE